MQPVVVPLPPDHEKSTSSPDHWISMPEPVHEPPPPVDDGLDDADATVPVPLPAAVVIGSMAEVAGWVEAETGSVPAVVDAAAEPVSTKLVSTELVSIEPASTRVGVLGGGAVSVLGGGASGGAKPPGGPPP